MNYELLDNFLSYMYNKNYLLSNVCIARVSSVHSIAGVLVVLVVQRSAAARLQHAVRAAEPGVRGVLLPGQQPRHQPRHHLQQPHGDNIRAAPQPTTLELQTMVHTKVRNHREGSISILTRAFSWLKGRTCAFIFKTLY